ncbi:MAG TPA: uroporphyrinogen decarboxylase family protein [Ruminiclostridium sp.]
MKPFNKKFTDINEFINNKRTPNFENLLSVLRREKPSRPTLFEFFLNEELYNRLTCHIKYDAHDELTPLKRTIDAFRITGYDYVTMHGTELNFKTNRHQEKQQASVSMNGGAIISDRKTFESYEWPDPDNCDYSRLEKLASYLPNGMKIIVYGPGGVLENVTSLVGYENLCYMIIDDPELVQDIFDAVGSIFIRYYEICSKYESVGALISNDDWGFNTQTMLSVEDMRKYVIPWHKKIAETIHLSKKPAILHSCGKLDSVIDDIIDGIKYDAKHSYEDKIRSVENAYEKYGERIATLGGLDVDFVCRSTPEEVYLRAAAMLEKASVKGGYALGSGNSIPYYVPQENYFAMIAAAVLE